MADWLPALAGIFKGLEGLPQGMAEEEASSLKKRQQAEVERRNLATEQQAQQSQAGAFQRAMLPFLMQKAQAKADETRAQQAGAAIGNIGAVEGPPLPQGAMGPGSPVRDPDMEALGSVLPYLTKEQSPSFVEYLKGRTPKATGSTVQGPEGAYNVIRDKQGNVTSATPMGIGPTEGKSPFQRSDVEAALTEAGWTPSTPGYRRAYLDVARQIPVAGAGVFGGGQMVIPPVPPSHGPSAAPAPSGRVQPRLPIGSSAPEVTARSEQQYSIDELRDLAQQLRAVAPGAQARLSLATRKILQGLPVAEVSQQLTAQEQDLLSRLGHAQMRYEKALAGVRGAASPQMYDRIKKIFGSPTSATTPDGLEGLANALDHFMQTEQGAEASSGRPVIQAPSLHTPSPGLGKPESAVRWGRDAQGRPVRLP